MMLAVDNHALVSFFKLGHGFSSGSISFRRLVLLLLSLLSIRFVCRFWHEHGSVDQFLPCIHLVCSFVFPLHLRFFIRGLCIHLLLRRLLFVVVVLLHLVRLAFLDRGGFHPTTCRRLRLAFVRCSWLQNGPSVFVVHFSDPNRTRTRSLSIGCI